MSKNNNFRQWLVLWKNKLTQKIENNEELKLIAKIYWELYFALKSLCMTLSSKCS